MSGICSVRGRELDFGSIAFLISTLVEARIGMPYVYVLSAVFLPLEFLLLGNCGTK